MALTKNSMQLADWRRTIAELYAMIRHESDEQIAWQNFRNVRDDLFLNHTQTPLNKTQRENFSGLAYFPYDPALRVVGALNLSVVPESYEVDLSADGRFCYTRIAKVHFAINDHPSELELYWVEGYGGGLFLPFRDATNKGQTYGGGRYLYDAIKGADLGANEDGSELLLDFNFAYNPSCAYNDQWVCPLAPQANWLTISIEAGEKQFLQLEATIDWRNKQI